MEDKKRLERGLFGLETGWLLILAGFIYILGGFLLYPSIFQLALGRWKRSLAIMIIYFMLGIGIWVSFLLGALTGGVLCILIPLVALVQILILPASIYDAYLIYKCRPALFENNGVKSKGA